MPVLRQGAGQTWLYHSNFVKSGRVGAATSARLFSGTGRNPDLQIENFGHRTFIVSIAEPGFRRSS